MKHPGLTQNFSTETIARAFAIVSIFETGKPAGAFDAVVVLDDGAGVSYGIAQFTHRSGSLLAVVEKYFLSNEQAGREVLDDRLTLLRKRTRAAVSQLAADDAFKNALRLAAETQAMRDAQCRTAFDRYLAPALAACAELNFRLPLSLAVVLDSFVHGSWMKIYSTVTAARSDEKAWIAEYVHRRDRWLASLARLRKTRYRTKFFTAEIARANWTLDLPLSVNGRKLTSGDLLSPELTALSSFGRDPHPATPETSLTADVPQSPAASSIVQPASTDLTVSSSDVRPSDTFGERLRRLQHDITCAAERYDRVEDAVRTVVIRGDSAKALWTTVIGTLWQTFWAIAGFLTGMPRGIWLGAAVIAGALMLLYLYRQIALGRLRELQRRIH
jgi:hypothetical protein